MISVIAEIYNNQKFQPNTVEIPNQNQPLPPTNLSREIPVPQPQNKRVTTVTNPIFKNSPVPVGG